MGFTVEIDQLTAFLPGSQVDVRPVVDMNALSGIKQPFKILKMDEVRGNIVVSRKSILEASYSKEVEELLATIEEGAVLEGVVKNITDYGAFIDLGKIDGLVHVTDISWSRISHPSEKLKLGETVKVKVIKYDSDKKQVSLGIKQLTEDPWIELAKKYKSGTIHEGVVSNITNYGVFVNIAGEIEGLVHVSELTWAKNALQAKNQYRLNDLVKVKVINVDITNHRVSLSIKQCNSNPWTDFADKHKVGDVVEGVIKNIVDFGLFIGFEDEVDGLVHISDLSWNQDGRKLISNYNVGDKIKVKLILIDCENERIALGVKQLIEDSFKTETEKLKKRSGNYLCCYSSKRRGYRSSI